VELLPLVIDGLRAAVAVAVLASCVGGIPPLVRTGLALGVGLWVGVLVGALEIGPGLGGAIGAGGALGSGGLLPDVVDVIALVAREAIIGATLGIVAAVPLIAAQTAGRLVDRAGDTRGTYAGLFAVLAGAVFVGIDGHVTTVASIVESHRSLPILVDTQPRVLAALAVLVPAAVKLAVPWLVTAAVVELGIGVGMRLGARAALTAPTAAAVPAAFVMMTAALVSTLAVAIAAVVRGVL